MENKTKKTKAYIAGKVFGLPPDAVMAKFSAKEKALRKQGYDVINPVIRLYDVNLLRVEMDEEPLSDDKNRKEIMGICLYDLSTCDELHLLHDWQESQGALQEQAFANTYNIKIVYP